MFKIPISTLFLLSSHLTLWGNINKVTFTHYKEPFKHLFSDQLPDNKGENHKMWLLQTHNTVPSSHNTDPLHCPDNRSHWLGEHFTCLATEGRCCCAPVLAQRCWGPERQQQLRPALSVRNNGAVIKVEMTRRHLASGSLENLLCAACFVRWNGGLVGRRVPWIVGCKNSLKGGNGNEYSAT